MTHTRIAPFLAVAAAAAICAFVPRPSAAGPRPPVGATDKNAANKNAADKNATDKNVTDKKPMPQAPSLPDEYRMSAGDKLRIEVYKDPQLSQSVQVRPDGKVTLPLIGDIEAAGKTPIELRDTIGASLKEYITNPTVTVIVVEATAATAYVVGEVNHPGAISLQAPLTVLQALAMAGGLKDFANAKNIRILRKGTWGLETINFNYKDAVKSARAPIYLRPGDTVVVPD